MQRLQRSFWSIYGRFVWEKHQSVWKQQQIERVVSTLQNLSHGSSKRVLDAGCGTGEYAAALAKAGFVVVGVDYAPGMLLHAEKKVEPDLSERLLFQQMRLDKNLLFRDGEFDHVINISALQLMPDPMFTLKELWRVLKPEGALFLLHVPKPAYDGSLGETIRARIAHSGSVSLGDKLLIAVKAWAERTGKTRYWTLDEVKMMVKEAGFEIDAEYAEAVIIILARKSF